MARRKTQYSISATDVNRLIFLRNKVTKLGKRVETIRKNTDNQFGAFVVKLLELEDLADELIDNVGREPLKPVEVKGKGKRRGGGRRKAKSKKREVQQ